MLHLCICLDLLHFVSLVTLYAVERNVVAYCHAYNLRLTNQSWQTSPNESVIHFEAVFVACSHQIGKLVQVVYVQILLIVLKLHKFRQKLVY